MLPRLQVVRLEYSHVCALLSVHVFLRENIVVTAEVGVLVVNESLGFSSDIECLLLLLVLFGRSFSHVLESTVCHVWLAHKYRLLILDHSFSHCAGRLIVRLVGSVSDMVLKSAHNADVLERFLLRRQDSRVVEWVLSAQLALVDLLLFPLYLGFQKFDPLLNRFQVFDVFCCHVVFEQAADLGLKIAVTRFGLPPEQVFDDGRLVKFRRRGNRDYRLELF